MQTVKVLYPTSEVFFESFIQSDTGKEIKENACSQFPKFNYGGKDTNQAVSFILGAMTDWLYGHEPELNDIDIEAYMDTNAEEIQDLVYANLT